MKKWEAILLSIIILSGCKKPYNPPAIASPGSYLVVEGVINAGADSTVITLSKTVSLSSASGANPVLNAVVTVESNKNNVYPLTDAGNGKYFSAGLNLDNTLQYRLNIKTSNNEQYQSAFQAVAITPPIDSLGFVIQNTPTNTGIQVYLNTHDPSNKTKYYRWDYQETWQFHAEYESDYITNGKAIVPRTQAQMVFSCFAGDVSSNIILGSTATLAQAVISRTPITQVASTSEKLESKYSILVNQYALTNDAYTFWQNLRTNTEQLGSIFDAQPSQINGNITCTTNPSEAVIGYISVSTIQRKRIFITNQQLPIGWLPAYPYQCGLDTNYYYAPGNGEPQVLLNLIPLNSASIPVVGFPLGAPSPLGFLASSPQCVDCTLRGTKIQPPFWQ